MTANRFEANLFDPTGRECARHIAAHGADDAETLECHRLPTLLIEPRDSASNKKCFLQNPDRPNIEEFLKPDGSFGFENSVHLADMLADQGKAGGLKAYFDCLKSERWFADWTRDAARMNILLISDDLDVSGQERLLRDCGMPRDGTLLLWRSVAICLGAEERLAKFDLQDGARVAVVDVDAFGRVSAVVLEMKSDRGRLVPSRSSFRFHRERFPIWKTFGRNELALMDDFNLGDGADWNIQEKKDYDKQFDFWLHTWRNGRCGEETRRLVPDGGGGWTFREFGDLSYRYENEDMLRKLIRDSDCIVASGNVRIPFLEGNAAARLIREDGGDSFALKGAARFAVRRANGLPTYFDEVEPLCLVVQDQEERRIEKKDLLNGKDRMRGGERIECDVNTDFWVEKGSGDIEFYVGLDMERTTRLKKLALNFGRTAENRQPLKLQPIIIPGQGFAKVVVDGAPLLRDSVELDFLSMTETAETVETLEKKLPRDYPLDSPQVEASGDLYEAYCKKELTPFFAKIAGGGVDAFLHRRSLPMPDGQIFARQRKNPKALGKVGVEALMRINVFGLQEFPSHPDKVLPNKRMWHCFFEFIAEKYKRAAAGSNDRNACIRIAAWTYRCGRKEFEKIIRDVLKKVKQAVDDPTIKFQSQEFSVCANMLDSKEQAVFFHAFLDYAENRMQAANAARTNLTNVDRWVRALMWILMYSNDFLNEIPSNRCKACMKVMLNIWRFHIRDGKSRQYVNQVVGCMLFLLRRRKFDRSFLKAGGLYDSIMACSNQPRFLNSSSLAEEFFKHMEGKGSLNIPVGDLIDGGDDGN